MGEEKEKAEIVKNSLSGCTEAISVETLISVWKSKTRLKTSSIGSYIYDLKKFLRWVSETEKRPIDEYEFLKFPLDPKMFDLTEAFIRLNEIRFDDMSEAEIETKMAPKRLNSTYCAIKKWLLINGIINNTKLFKQIDFNKTSPKRSAIDQEVIEIRHLKQAFTTLPLDEKVDIGLYSLCALRPQIIHALKIRDILPNFYTIKSGKIELRKPTLVVGRTPNKGNFDFLIVLPIKLGEWLELYLNTKIHTNDIDKIKDIKLGNCRRPDKCDTRDLNDVTNKLFKSLGLAGASPYTLRSLGDTILERLTYVHNDEDLKEFLMNHTGKISSTYGLKGILKSTERQDEILRKYQCVDTWINENIFELRGKEEKEKADIIADFAKLSGVSEEKVKAIRELFDTGKMSLEQLKEEIFKVSKDATRDSIRSEIRSLIKDEIKNGV